jgi:cell division protein FtsI/penicillin-binding protein 2
MWWKDRLSGRFLTAALCLTGVATAAAAPSDTPLIRFSSLSWNEGTAYAQDTQGAEVALGLEGDLQKSLEYYLTRARPIAGAAVVVDARTGQVLAASEIGNDPKGSLLFDAISPAASVFKIVTTAALYEHTDVTPLTQVCTKGGNRDILREHLSPASGPGTTCTRFAHALGVSRNAVYAQLATQKLLREDLIRTAENLGFGDSLGLDEQGSLGSLEVPYNDLAFARTAAGFENSRLSVFGAAQLALIVASGGMKKPMHFRSDVKDVAGTRVLSSQTARRLRNAMEVTIHSGTARESFVDAHGRSTVGPVQVAGKTGTLKPDRGSPTSSWFLGFAPSEDPRVVVSVLLKNPDKWHQKGHQVGRDLIGAYLKKLGVRGVKNSP